MEKHVGPIFKIHRRKKNFSLIDIEGKTTYSKSTISDFENKKRQLSNDDIVILYKILDIDYRMSCEKDSEVRELFYQLFNSITFMLDEDTNIFQKILLLEEDVRCSTSYIVFMLSSFLYHVYHPSDTCDYSQSIQVLNTYKEYLHDGEKQIYADTLGVYYKDSYQYEKALNEFAYALSFKNNGMCNAMANYHKTMILNVEGRLTDALVCIKEAKKLFDEQLNIKRSINSTMLLANTYTYLGRFELGEKLNKQCIQAMRLVPMKNNLVTTYNNLLWAYILSNKYTSVLSYGKQVLKLDGEKASYYFYMSYAEYKLGNKEHAKEWVKTAIQFKNDATKYMQAIIHAFNAFLSDTKEYSIKKRKLEIAYDEAVKIKDYQLEIFVLELLIEVEELYNSGKNNYIYLKKVNDLYKNRK